MQSVAHQSLCHRAPTRLVSAVPLRSVPGRRPGPFTSSFLTATLSRPSQFTGTSLVVGLPARNVSGGGQRGALTVVANSKNSMGNTFGGTNRKRRKVSGFRARMATPGGRRVLRRRRAKGRKFLCPASMRKGKYVTKSRRG